MSSILDFSGVISDMASEQTGSEWAEQFALERESGLYVRTDDPAVALTMGGFFAHAYGKVGKGNGALEIIRGLVRSGAITAEQRDAVRFGRYGDGDLSRQAIHEAIVAFVAGLSK